MPKSKTQAHQPEPAMAPTVCLSGVDQELLNSFRAISAFVGPSLRTRIGDLERAIKNCGGTDCRAVALDAGATSGLLAAAHSIKRAASQINVLIHAVGALLLIPQIMELDEKIESVSLGAGNTGRDFDLNTDRRVAEFKFIHWQGGPESIRQNNLFKDFYTLAEHRTTKRKELYVLGTTHALRFFNGGRALRSVISRNGKLWDEFRAKYGDEFTKVKEYYSARKHQVILIDAGPLVPELARVVDAADSEEEQEKL